MSRWVIMGSMGFIGSTLIRTLESLGELVVGRSRMNWSLDFEPSDHVVNCVGRLVGSKDELEFANAKLVEELARAAPASFTHLGSAAEYGPVDSVPVLESQPCRPVSDYGVSKLNGTQAVFKQHPRSLIIRPSNVVGPGMAKTSLVSQIRHAPHGALFEVNRMDVVRDFIDVRDLCAGLIHLVKRGDQGIFHVGSGVPTDLRQLMVAFHNCGHMVHLRESPLAQRKPEAPSFVASIEKLRSTGFAPTRDLHQMVKSLFS